MEWLKKTWSGTPEKTEEVEVKPVDGKEFEEGDCTTCDSPCALHPPYPEFLSKKINQTDPLYGTVKTHKKHLVVCTGEPAKSWPPKIEKAEGTFEGALAKQVKKADLPFQVLVTASEESSLDSEKRKTLGPQGACDVLVFPEMIRYLSLSQNEIQDLIKEHLLGDSVLSKVDHQKLDKKAYILICGHVKRDKRCGVTAPLLVEEFQKILKAKGLENQVAISQVSHIGGHKYAGNVIIYPGGVWYGRVIPCHVEDIVEKHINQGKILKKIFRGQMDSSDISKIKNLNW